MNIIEERLKELRKKMDDENLDAYVVMTDDYHASEYVGDYFKCREYISGFTGSAGTVVILHTKAGLWTDGRYFLQAEAQLKGSGIKLFRIGEENVPTIEEYLKENAKKGMRIGIDGKTLSTSNYKTWEKNFKKENISICIEKDLIGEIWANRPKMSCEPVWELKNEYSGKNRKDKINEIRKIMKKKEIDASVIASLDDISWLLNLRGNDIKSTPVVLSYLVITRTNVHFYVQEKAVSNDIKEKMIKEGISFHEYNDIYKKIEGIENGNTIYIDPRRLNILLFKKLQEQENNVQIVEGANLTELPKAIKNPIEINNIRIAHKKDAVACIKFIYWLKSHIGKEKITELSATRKLETFRNQQSHYIEPSFDTITGYGSHGAIVHYSATEETDCELKTENFVLIDSGGHYLEGTTDITRTIALGELSIEQKHHYTLVLKSNIKLASAIFKYGCSGINLDYLAREFLWEEGLDYNHGTGHGVGYLLNVHEGPNGIRYRMTPNRDECCVLEEGMVTSNEPGLYFAGKYGIRIENLMVCRKLEKTEFGQFMHFETITLVPMEREAILIDEMTQKEIEFLNSYHKLIYDTLKNELTQDEREWLHNVTVPLAK